MIGKFENEEALLKSYSDLEKEFTKKCQELSKLKREVEEREKQVEDDAEAESVELVDANEAVEVIDLIEDAGTGEEAVLHEIVEAVEGDNKNDCADSSLVDEDENVDFNNLIVRARANEFLINNTDAREYARDIAKLLMKDKSLMKCADPFQVAYALVLKDRRKDERVFEEGTKKESVKEEKNVQEEEIVKPNINLLGRNASVFSPARVVQKFRTMDDAREELLRRFS